MQQYIPVVVSALAAFAVALWNPDFLRNIPGLPDPRNGVSYVVLSLVALAAGALAITLMGSLTLEKLLPVLAVALTIVVLGVWNPEWMTQLPGGRDSVLAGSGLLVGILAQMLTDMRM